MPQPRAEFRLADPVLDVGAAAKPRLDPDDVRAVVGGDVRDDETHRPHVVDGPVQGQLELVFRNGAAAPRPGVTGDLLGVDPDPPDDRVSAWWPALRRVVDRTDLGAGHVPGGQPRRVRDGGVGPPQRRVAFGRDREVGLGVDRGMGEFGAEVPVSARTRARPHTAGARRSSAPARGRTSSLPANRSAASGNAAYAQLARCGRPAR